MHLNGFRGLTNDCNDNLRTEATLDILFALQTLQSCVFIKYIIYLYKLKWKKNPSILLWGSSSSVVVEFSVHTVRLWGDFGWFEVLRWKFNPSTISWHHCLLLWLSTVWFLCRLLVPPPSPFLQDLLTSFPWPDLHWSLCVCELRYLTSPFSQLTPLPSGKSCQRLETPMEDN